MNNSKLALNLSKTSIQLLKKGSKRTWIVLGSVDPSSKNLNKDLVSLRNQAAALSTKRPIVDILLPRELVLSQTIVIENDFSVEHCKKVTAKRCGLNENELFIAIGDSSTKSTVPVAAIAVNSIIESRNFVKRAGFRPEKYIASSKISGFKKSPVFFNDNSSKRLFDIEGKTITQVLALTSMLMFAGFLVSLTTTFLEYRSKNRPYNYLADPEIFNSKQNSLKTEFTLLEKAKQISSDRINISKLEPKSSKFIYTPQAPKVQKPKLKSVNKFSFEVQLKSNFETTQIKKLNVGRIIVPILAPEKPTKFDELQEISNLQKADLVFLKAPENKSRGTLPKIDKDYPSSIDGGKKLSKERRTNSNRLESIRALAAPKKEKSINHKYEKIFIEEIFSDMSLTKIIISTSNKRASTLPLLFFDTKKPDILDSDKLMSFDFINDKDEKFIRPTDVIGKKEFLISSLEPTYKRGLMLNNQLIVKLKEQGLNINELNSRTENAFPNIVLWNGKKPPVKPKIIDSIKVLEDPTRSTGAVTFVELPPGMPSVVSKLERIAANSVRNLNVKSKPPSIPKRASIVGNSTLKNLIELNRTNLIGIFGKRTGRIALIRLSSGSTIKVKVGQRFGNGWRVISIDLDKIHITNGSRQETLRIPG